MNWRLLCLWSCLWAAGVSASIDFRETAASRGLAYRNTDVQSVAWVDFDNDGWLDLWLTGHHMTQRFFRSKLYLNKAGKLFEDTWPSLPLRGFDTDAHGVTWLDRDNDGDQDLFVVGGGGAGVAGRGSPTLVFSNRDGRLSEEGAKLGLDDPLGRGRLSFWFDDNRDGKLDVFVVNVGRRDGKASRNRLYHQTDTGFKAVELSSKVAREGVGQIFLSMQNFPPSVATPLHVGEKQHDGLSAWLVQGNKRVVTGDFDGDGILDHVFYQPQGGPEKTCHVRSEKGAVLAFIPRMPPGKLREFRFEITGPVKLNSKKSPVLQFWKGESSRAEKYGSRILSRLDEDFNVKYGTGPAISNGMHLGRDPADGVWTVRVHQAPGIANAIQFVLTPLTPNTRIRARAPECEYQKTASPLFWSGGAGKPVPFQVEGMPQRWSLGQLMSGDFDNDGDLDLYASRETPLKDMADMILENMGGGRFRARGVMADMEYDEPGVYLRELIPGPHGVVGDYDNDGFLDLFLAGRHYYSWRDNPRLVAGVPNRLLTNKGNSRHWLKIRLQGTGSNRDAIGARVILHAGGNAQVRLQSGGQDAYQQHAKLLHFGLGSAVGVDAVEVIWPSGRKSRVTGVAVDQVLTIREPVSG